MKRRAFIKTALAGGVVLWLPQAKAMPPPILFGSGSNSWPTNGLLAHWPLTLATQCADTSGNGNNGTPYNSFGNTTVANHKGVTDGAIKINSIGGQYATFPDVWTADWSVALWVKCDADATASYNRIIGQNLYMTDLALNLDAGSNKPTAYDGSWHFIGEGAAQWNVGEWHHLAITYNSTGPVGELYFDGAANHAQTYTNFSTEIWLGADYQGISPGNISVSQMFIYNRPLGAAEVARIYNNT